MTSKICIKLAVILALAPLFTDNKARAQAQRDTTRLTTDRDTTPQPVELIGIRVLGARVEALTRFPGSARLVLAAEIVGRQPASANEILRSVPGIHVQEEEGLGLRANIGIRGLDPDRSRTVLVLEDGVPVALAPYGEPELYYSPPIERMERIEIIKGSGSILFGPQTIGGVINYVTGDAPRTPTGSAVIRGGNGYRLVRGSYGGTWDNTRATVGLFRRSTTDLAGLVSDARDLTAKVGFATPRGTAGLKLSIYDESSNSTYVGLTDSLFAANPYVHPSPTDRLWLRRYAVTGTHETAVGTSTTLRTNAYAYQTTRDWMRRNYTYNATRSAHVFQDATGNRNRAFEVAGVEPRLSTSFSLLGLGAAIEAGGRLHYERARDQFIAGGSATSRTGAARDDEIRTGRAAAAFVQNRLSLAPGLEVVPGLRLEHFEYDRHILRTRIRRASGSATTNVPEDVDVRSSDRVSAAIPGMGIAYSPSARLTIFGGVHRGFAPPRTKDALVYDDPQLQPEDQVPALRSLQLDAESSRNYELGARFAPIAFLDAELTGFWLDFANQIIEPSLSAGSVAEATLANQGRTLHTGFEASISSDLGLMLNRSFSFAGNLSYTFVDAVFSADRFVQTAAGDTVNVRDNQLPYAPRQRISGGVAYAGPQGLEVRGDLIWTDEQFSDIFETREPSANGRVGRIPSHRIIDISARYRLPLARELTATASVKNATNELYVASRRPEGIKPGLPRLIAVGLAVGF